MAKGTSKSDSIRIVKPDTTKPKEKEKIVKAF